MTAQPMVEPAKAMMIVMMTVTVLVGHNGKKGTAHTQTQPTHDDYECK
jgi:hypothetical protein